MRLLLPAAYHLTLLYKVQEY